MPSNHDLIAQREADALAFVADLIERLEAAGERVEVSQEAYERDIAWRDRVVVEAIKAGLTLELIARVSGLKHAPHVCRARDRHKRRMVTAARARKVAREDG